ncbi:MAG: magnesium transporter [Gammaproteobacteria bacterium]|nr:magnesium transporter [Gammaproteobacteria bacterium]
MPDTQSQQSNQRLTDLSEILHSCSLQQAQRTMNALHPAEIASLLESLPLQQRELLWKMVDPNLGGQVLMKVGDEVRSTLLQDMETTEILAATEKLELDDLADFLQSLPNTLIQETLQGMDKQNRHRLETVLSFEEDSAGGLMDLDAITVRADVTLDVVLRYLRLKGNLPRHTDRLFVVNRYDTYLGVLSIRKLLTNDPDLMVADIMKTDVEAIHANRPATEVARLFEDHDLISAPVVDLDNKLIGRITVDDVMDVIREEAEHTLMSRAGLNNESDLFAPVIKSSQQRAIWLGLNLMTAFLASWVISLFEATLDQIVALAILMPIVASMGGIAGSQTLTLVIRGQALGHLGKNNTRSLLAKEVAVSLLNGCIWAVVVAAITFFWFQDLSIGLTIAAALIFNMFTSALAGVSIPILLSRFGIDPALAGSVILTTITDVIGFMAFLGLATLFLLP